MFIGIKSVPKKPFNVSVKKYEYLKNESINKFIASIFREKKPWVIWIGVVLIIAFILFCLFG